MADSANFPSGEWIGFYVYAGRPRRFLMDLILRFSDGRIDGEGCDGIGNFAIIGDYSESTMDCSWTKTYINRHSVDYVGFKEGKRIWGTWTLPTRKGGFQIWPIGSEPNLDGISAEERTEIPKEDLQAVGATR